MTHLRLLASALAALSIPAAALASPQEPRFETDVLPILTTYCFTCHGQSSPKLGLDLRTAASTLKGSHNGPVIVKGSLEQSLLWKKVSSRAMPPAIYGQKVPDGDIDIIKRWIESGAPADQASSAAAKAAAGQHARFERELLPIFKARCLQCHGEKSPMAGLSLDSVAAVLKGGSNGPVIVEGFSDRSLLVRRIRAKTMPPPAAGKALSDAEVRVIAEWIDRGNFSESVSVDSAERPFTPLEAPPVTAEQRKFWSFQKPSAAILPKVRTANRVRNPIDAFVLEKLESKGLSLSPEESDIKLMRRAYFDLIGLPPTPGQIKDYLAAEPATRYERLLDQLLASPQYGERWARPWLDAIGYVDTTGKDFEPSKTEYAEGMWRYRDYVIRAINADKPWSRFLTEQLAGDELVDWQSAKKYTPETIDLLTATGYLRNILDITAEDISNLPVERYEALFKLIEKVGSSTLGLTVGCARCHSHKFDPISQRDYYRFLALFATSYNPTDWLQPQNRFLWPVSKLDKEAIDRHNASVEAPLKELKKQLAALTEPYEKRLLDRKLNGLPEAIRNDTRIALETAADKRDDIQKYLVKKFSTSLKVSDQEVRKELSDSDRQAVSKLDGQIHEKQKQLIELEKIQALWDVGTPPSIRLLQRGSADAPGPKVTPGFFEVLAEGRSAAVRPEDTAGKSSGMRLALARWLTSSENPLTARVIVNRFWQGHFSVGIVATPDNFGKMGAVPSNQKLLDWLAVDFMNHGWSAKYLHKLIMMSSTYRQTSRMTQESWVSRAKTVDPENALLWRMNLRRLDAESLRDSLIAVSGKFDAAQGGPAIKLEMQPDGVQVVSSHEPGSAKWRRSIYLTARRTYPVSFLGVFDYPIIDTHCARRVPSATPLQSLTMMNDGFVWQAASHLAGRISELAGENASDEAKIKAAYELTLSRQPSDSELRLGREFLLEQQKLFSHSKDFEVRAPSRALAALTQALVNSNEFLYVD